MGMFDYITVDTELRCPKCKAVLSEFQSKSGPCLMETLPYWQVDYFYAICPSGCGIVEFSLPLQARPRVPIGDYSPTINGEVFDGDTTD